MSEEKNPYASPEFDEEKHASKDFIETKSIVPGRAVGFFGFMTLLIPAVIFEESSGIMAVYAVMYSVPAGIATLYFSLQNIKRGAQTIGDYIGLSATIISFASGIYFLTTL